MKVPILIRSYAPDFEWLSYCLKSIHKFASGFQEIVIITPEADAPLLGHLTAERVIPVHDGVPKYLCQQSDKLHADIHCPNADFICHIDSDCILTQPVTPQTFMRDGKPLWLMTPWKDCFESKKTWAHIMLKCVQEYPEHEFMRRHGQLLPRWAYGAFRDFIQNAHGMTMTEYVMSQPGHEYSEFNTMGFYLWLYHRDKISWWDTSVEGVPPAVMDQHWSWGGMTQELRNKLAVSLA